MFLSGSQFLFGSKEAASNGRFPVQNDANILTCGELFSGCGGMAAGLTQAGLRHEWMIEFNAIACQTLRDNWHAPWRSQPLTIMETDVRSVDWSSIGTVDIVAGGPPCQPFSKGGRAGGENDPRDMWPEAIRAVKHLRPRGFLFENVKGLLRPAFSEYLQRILDSLRRAGATEPDSPDVYEVIVVSVNAVDYGAAQKRERVLIAGVRRDCGKLEPFPERTHSVERLVWEKWVSGQYWQRHHLAHPVCGPTSRIEKAALRKVERRGVEPQERPWMTCRDVFVGLGEPAVGSGVSGHQLRAGAKAYPGHEGSPIDEPAKALKAGAHGVPGGENMLVDCSGAVRYFTVREAARLQGMPDAFVPAGSWSQAMRQLGNAVPAQLAEVAGRWIRQCARGQEDNEGKVRK
ncbi:DNA (cytosine-5)-methyltransferase 1 [Paraburkholderia sp. JPY158]|uniref:Cytosine-specific methyltransferase n=1 Tax=Paraburkholderia atlantica TaxID=2654982 RepID=A0A7W8Q2N0_PARAM|nr:DNA (cytosine-5-)-methyltransferase [Paraburkholderia atlantica]MBB5422638.1 DNA (cytosine-5)-methyltransferase 1 [Paraburkholderia atlantica]